MKEMIYRCEVCKEILEESVYKEHKFAILNLGLHPTAYVECKLANVSDYHDDRIIDVDVHGGFTYLGENYWSTKDGKLYLGWDYGHYGDYSGFYEHPNDKEIYIDLLWKKKWTTEEIIKEVKSVIDQLIIIELEEKGVEDNAE